MRYKGPPLLKHLQAVPPFRFRTCIPVRRYYPTIPTRTNSKQNLAKENELSSSSSNDKAPPQIKLNQIDSHSYNGSRTYKLYQATCVPNDGYILVRLIQVACYFEGNEAKYSTNSFIAKFSSDGKILDYCLPVTMNTNKSGFFSLYPCWESINNYYSIVPNPNNNLVYIASCFTNNVTVFNPQTNTVLKNISVGNCPASMYLDTQNSILYVTNHGDSNISLINISDNELVGNISVGGGPSSIIYDPYNKEIYVSNTLSENISVIDPNTQKVIRSITTNSSIGQLIMNSNGSCIFADSYSNNSISILNISSNIVRTINISGGNPINILYDNESNSIYITIHNDEYLSIFNLNSNTISNSTNTTIYDPMTLFYDSQDNFIVVTSWYGNPDFAFINPSSNHVYETYGNLYGVVYSDYIYSPDSGKQILISLGGGYDLVSYEIVNQTKTVSFTEILAIIVVVILASSIGYLVYRRHQFWKD